MKVSWLIAGLILLVGAFVAWRQQAGLDEAAADYRRQVERAAEAGLPVEGGRGEAPLGGKLAERQSASGEVGRVARGLIALARESASGQPVAPPDPEREKELYDQMAELLELEPGEMAAVIEELRSTPELDEEAREGLLSLTLMILARKDPEQALALHAGAGDLNDYMEDQVIATAAASMVTRDPMAALRWLEENRGRIADPDADRLKHAVLQEVAADDPAEALRLAGELGVEKGVGADLAFGALSDEKRSKLLGVLRGQGDEHLRREALMVIGSGLVEEGFESAAAWLDGAELSEDEAAALVRGLGTGAKLEDTGPWIDWAVGHAGEEAAESVGRMMGLWTQADYRAAGEWLTEAEDGPVMRAAVASYAATVAPFDSEAAAAWVDTLPAGDSRREVARRIHSAWEKGAAGRDDFARREGLDLAE